MRTMKFRVYDRERNLMGLAMKIDFEKKEVWYAWDVIEGGHLTTVKSFNEVILMQFTGLHDKNGKEIYEGDILKFDKQEWYRSPVLSRKEIDDKPEYFFDISWDRDGWSYCGGYSDLKTYCEIVGTIYTTPELLNKEK